MSARALSPPDTHRRRLDQASLSIVWIYLPRSLELMDTCSSYLVATIIPESPIFCSHSSKLGKQRPLLQVLGHALLGWAGQKQYTPYSNTQSAQIRFTVLRYHFQAT
jgi:hypothetical protein